MGSFRCSCAAGFHLDADGLTCHDINECQANNGNCSQKCINTQGDHSCSCFEGFVNSGSNGTDVICIDIGAYLIFFLCLLLFLPGYFIVCKCKLSLLGGGLFLSLTFLRKMFIRLVTSVGQRKESPEESNLRPSDSALWRSTTEPQRLHGERGLLRSSYDTRPNLVVVRLVFYCPIFFCLFLFCFVFFVASVEELYQILTAQSETWFPTLSLLFLWSLLSLYAFHRRVFWWDTPVWQSREMPQHSR